jgi:hypothetical protein
MSANASRRRPLNVLACVLLFLTAAGSVRQLYASKPGGCCGSPDCGVIAQPYKTCSSPGQDTPKECNPPHENYTFCCDLDGWCG